MRVLTIAVLAALPGFADQSKKEVPLPPESLYLLKTKTLEGKDADLKAYAGKVALVVNLASQ